MLKDMNSIWATNQHNQPKQKGFTIVELLIVIVVIGILAAITVVAYNGISNRSKTAAAQSAASSVAKKAGAYNAELGNWPTATTDLTGAATTTSYNLTGVTFVTTMASKPTPDSAVLFRKCGTGAPANQAALTTANTTGIQFIYWNHGGSGSAATDITVGTVSGAGVTCPTS